MIGAGWSKLRRRSMIVNLDTGTTFEGVLVRASGPLLMFRNARLLERGRDALAIDGEVVVERARVEFGQVELEARRP